MAWQVFPDAQQLQPAQLYQVPLSIITLPHQALSRTQSSPASSGMKSTGAEPPVKHLFTTGKGPWAQFLPGGWQLQGSTLELCPWARPHLQPISHPWLKFQPLVVPSKGPSQAAGQICSLGQSDCL